MSSVWFADISMESLPGPRPVRPTVSLRPSMACFRQQSARLVDMHALKPCARSCFSLPENLTSPRSTRMPAEPHYPLSFQKSHFDAMRGGYLVLSCGQIRLLSLRKPKLGSCHGPKYYGAVKF